MGFITWAYPSEFGMTQKISFVILDFDPIETGVESNVESAKNCIETCLQPVIFMPQKRNSKHMIVEMSHVTYGSPEESRPSLRAHPFSVMIAKIFDA